MNERDRLLQVYQNEDNFRSSPWFICEGRWLVEILLEQAFEVHSVLVVQGQHEDLAANVPDHVPVITVTQEEADALLGFHFHRGVLAAGKKPEPQSLQDWLTATPKAFLDPRAWVIAPLLADPSNVGALMRNAAALGAGAVITSTAGASPWYRKAIRTSTGSVFRIPVISSPSLAEDLAWLREQASREILALALTEAAISIRDYRPTKPIALVVGPEDHGLDATWIDQCHKTLVIPMASGVDSLNAATSVAVALSALNG